MQKTPEEVFETFKVENIRLAKKAIFDIGVQAGIIGMQDKDKEDYKRKWIYNVQNCIPKVKDFNYDRLTKTFEEGYKEGLGTIG